MHHAFQCFSRVLLRASKIVWGFLFCFVFLNPGNVLGKTCFKTVITETNVLKFPVADASSAKRCDREFLEQGPDKKRGTVFCVSHHLKDAVRCTPVWSGYICSYFGTKPHHSREPRLCLHDLCTVLFIHSCFYWFCVGCVFFAHARRRASTL